MRKTWGDMAMEFKIRSMELLNDLGAKRTKGIQIKTFTDAINKEIIAKIEKVCAEFQGGTPLYVSLKDVDENITLELLSRKMRVKAGNELVVEMRKIVGVV